MHVRLHGDNDDHDIPEAAGMSITKLARGGDVMTDNCNAACLEGSLLCKRIRELAIAEANNKGIDESEILIQ